ncbi:hypothetical protein [Cupriavidus metallidurans]|uniref:hypothetical protein n=1 Tax=Cupriavidus metallidurans TaxID=119219 RepID=UPI001CCCEFFA|nr:hypothetical protein [Cupriavidus metallidurans]UBM12795.1 hypothetical protein LAI70_27975 [Cupriavidus metallidurans]
MKSIPIKLSAPAGRDLFKAFDKGDHGWSLDHTGNGRFNLVCGGVDTGHVILLNMDGTWHIDTVLPLELSGV